MGNSKNLENEKGSCSSSSSSSWAGRLRNNHIARNDVTRIRKSSDDGDENAKVRGKLCHEGSSERIRDLVNRKSLDDFVKDWAEKKVESGACESECVLPFLVKAPRMVECPGCRKFVYSDKVLCSVRGCGQAYHLKCVKEKLGFSTSKTFKCPQHGCFICQQTQCWRCIRCSIASHTKCAPWPDKVTTLGNQLTRAVCWRHPSDWHLEKKDEVPTVDIEEIFLYLPLPYTEEEYNIDLTWKEMMENGTEPIPYVHIKRNIYLTKKMRDCVDAGLECSSCFSTLCSNNCVCRVQFISCSKACHDSKTCTNRQFAQGKKVKVVKTQSCGWGLEAAELIEKGEFVVEYIGEVIDDDLCVERLWDMKHRGDKNFYMCTIAKNFTIDSTFKGNTARFMNHSCNPNCEMEKWSFNGETRAGIFATQTIEAGRELTYDYRFELYGPQVKCHCGAPNCRGYLGAKRKAKHVLNFSWNSKQPRS